jgi:hypothetical protein
MPASEINNIFSSEAIRGFCYKFTRQIWRKRAPDGKGLKANNSNQSQTWQAG